MNSATRLSSSPAGSTSSTRPVRSARSASISSPEKSRYLAAAGPTSDDQPPGGRGRIDDAELRRRHPEQRALLREPQIAGGGELAAAAHAVAADGGQRRLRERGERLLGRTASACGPRPGLPQRGDVGARAERRALAGQHQRPYRRVGGQPASSSGSARHIPAVIALRLAGLLMTTVATPSATVCQQLRLHAPDAITRRAI